MESHRDQQSLRAAAFQEAAGLPPDEVLRLAKDVEKEMLRAARDLEFERAAELRDRLVELRRRIEGEEESRSRRRPTAGRATPGRTRDSSRHGQRTGP